MIFSNLLSYYFNFDHKMFVKFAKEVLGISDMSCVFKTVRESMQNIDLWIEDEKQVLVIENKIKSGLNGKTGKGKTQLDKYFEYTQKYIKEHNIREAHYFIFVPDYNVIPLCDSDMKKHYKIVTYSEIYKFFKKYAAQYINDKYFADFLSGLQKHTMTLSELQFSIMRSRFLEKVNQR